MATSQTQQDSQTRTNSPPPPPTPLPIRRLDESLINRIAAGEIIHRPASALKELLENALDAQSTSIRVIAKDGGLKLLQIQDTGSGIRKDDLPLLASRFATSKLKSFADLSSLQTYGFRGEALASISHVAHLSVITKVRGDSCAWKAYYADGVLAPPKPGLSADPKPCAGNDGTTITVEDLFHSTPLRLAALKSTSEEYARILDVMTKYAVHNSSVSFICKKASSTSPDLSTPSGSTIPQTITLLYGSSAGKELLHVMVSSKKNPNKDVKGKGKARDDIMEVDEVISTEDERDGGVVPDEAAWKAQAYITGVNYHAKKATFLLFINNRLVESPRIKRAVEAVYGPLLPKGTCPFVYLSLHIDPRAVDVNVHPTKREVHFLDEEKITQKVCDAMQEALATNSGSRTFQYQTLLTGGILEDSELSDSRKNKEAIENDEDNAPMQRKVYSYQKVRTSTQDRTIDSMFPIMNPLQVLTDNTEDITGLKEINESSCILTSIRTLRAEVVQKRHNGLSEILEKHIFVGIVDLNRCLSLIQHATRLYLVNHAALAEELFYQLGLRQFGNLGQFKLDPPAPIDQLLSLAVEHEDGIGASGLDRQQVVDTIRGILISRRQMLEEYFSLSINEEGQVLSLPVLLRGYTPNLDKLPLFLMRLGPQVDWASERDCFESFLRELAYFYVPGPLLPSSDGEEEASQEEKSERWQIQHVIFPAMGKYLHAPKTLLDKDIVQVASLPDLYRVFERC